MFISFSLLKLVHYWGRTQGYDISWMWLDSGQIKWKCWAWFPGRLGNPGLLAWFVLAFFPSHCQELQRDGCWPSGYIGSWSDLDKETAVVQTTVSMLVSGWHAFLGGQSASYWSCCWSGFLLDVVRLHPNWYTGISRWFLSPNSVLLSSIQEARVETKQCHKTGYLESSRHWKPGHLTLRILKAFPLNIFWLNK